MSLRTAQRGVGQALGGGSGIDLHRQRLSVLPKLAIPTQRLQWTPCHKREQGNRALSSNQVHTAWQGGLGINRHGGLQPNQCSHPLSG